MKRILSVFFCLIFMCSIASCGWEVPYSGDELSEAPKTDETSEKNETTESASQDAPADGQLVTVNVIKGIQVTGGCLLATMN